MLREKISQQFTEEFKIQAVKQVTDQGYTEASVSERLGVTSNSLYSWVNTVQTVKNIGSLKNNPTELSR